MRTSLGVAALVGVAFAPCLQAAASAADAQAAGVAAQPTPAPPAHEGHGVGVMKLRRAHHQHAHERRVNTLLGVSFLSSLIGGEFTTLNINQPAPDNSRSIDRSLTGGEFTTLADSSRAPGASSRSSDSAETSTSSDSETSDSSETSSTSSTRSSTSSSTTRTPSSTAAGVGAASSSSRMATSSSSLVRSRSSSSTLADLSTSSSDLPSSSSAPTSTSDSTLSPVQYTTTTQQVHPTVDPSSNMSGQNSKDGGDNHIGTIVGVTVGVGVPLVAAALFCLYWFFGRRKRRNDDIQWPDINHDSGMATTAPLPARQTGGAGFDMGHEHDSFYEESQPHGLKSADSYGAESMMQSRDAHAVPETYVQQPYDAYAQQAQQEYDQYAQQQYNALQHANRPPPLAPETATEQPKLTTSGVQSRAITDNDLPPPHALSDGAEYQQYVVGETYPGSYQEGVDAPATRELYHGTQATTPYQTGATAM